jgi:hypothetical protein
MIHEAVKFINNNLNDFLKIQFNVDEQISVTNHIINLDGAAPPSNQNKLILTLFNISEENILKNFPAIDIDTIHQNRKKIYLFIF